MRLWVLVMIVAFLPSPGAAQSSAEAFAFADCMQACDAKLDPCCFESCAYSACIAGNSQVSQQGDLAQLGAAPRDTGAEQAAVAVCMPKVQPLQDCRAREAAAIAERNRPKPFIDLACCRYWAEQRGGRTVVTGWFRNPAGRQVRYTSEPVHPKSQAATAYGMFALANGVGYHVYFVDEGDAALTNGLVYVARFEDKVEPLYILRIGGRFWVDLKPDMSGGKVVYNTPDDVQAFYELPLK